MDVGIYKIISPSGKIYIGQSKNIQKRFKGYIKSHCFQQPKLHNSFNKYGSENHIFEIIEICVESELDKKEIYWINKFNTVLEGLNCKEGGSYGKQSDETKYKISLKNINTKKPKSKEFGENVSKRLKGNTYRKGSTHTVDSIDKIKKSLMGNKYALGHKMTEESKLKQAIARDKYKKRIFCPELNRKFDSISDCSIELGINIMSVSNIINGRTKKTRNGLTFKLINNEI